MAFAINVEIRDLQSSMFAFAAQKTMYAGKRIVEGDTVFVFRSKNEGALGGRGLIARSS